MGSTIYKHKKEGQLVHFNPGAYKFDCLGARGGWGLTNSVWKNPPGNGAWITAIKTFFCPTDLWFFIGSHGENGNLTTGTIAKGGWNGGGNGGPDPQDDDGAGAGGGATDIRTKNVNNDPLDSESLKSRILVAAGGSGSAYLSDGAPGGNETGFRMSSHTTFEPSTKTTQKSGYQLGKGESGGSHISAPSSGAGSGYYGGFTGIPQHTEYPYSNSYLVVGESGSSYIDQNYFFSGGQKMKVGGNHISEDGLIIVTLISSSPFGIVNVKGQRIRKSLSILVFHVFLSWV